MKTRQEIVTNWLPRYTGVPLKDFGRYILLTNFHQYVTLFARWHHVKVMGHDKPMPSATADDITIINFGMGSATAATVMDLLSAIHPKAVLFLGKCGGIKHRAGIGDLILPIAAIRGEGTSGDYFPPEVPALPSFALQKAISTTIREHARDYWTGTVYTTNRRVWEHDDKFKKYLKKIRVMAVDMETATIFMTGFQRNPHGRAVASLRPAHGARGSEDGGERQESRPNLRQRSFAHRHRLAEAAHQPAAHGEASQVLDRGVAQASLPASESSAGVTGFRARLRSCDGF